MTLQFRKLGRSKTLSTQARNMAFLAVDNWDDYSYKTLFYLHVYDESGQKHEIGGVKIGFVGQPYGMTADSIPDEFDKLDTQFFSLGQDVEYYKNITKNLSKNLASCLLLALCDLANNDDLLAIARNESVFTISLLRGVSVSAIQGQFKRILSGGVILTEFEFSYSRPTNEKKSGIELGFHVKPNSTPPTNTHILIGRNGVGKTTLLNDMANAIINRNKTDEEVGQFYDLSDRFGSSVIPDNYFTSVSSLSFSAFDPFIPLQDKTDRSQGTCYFYIGLKKANYQNTDSPVELKSLPELGKDFVHSIKTCFSLKHKKDQWLSAIQKLESDSNFADMDLTQLANLHKDLQDREADLNELNPYLDSLFRRLSSGHAIVLLSITKLIETVEEKTLVLIDEPESHLHPPLLSAFIRALSDLLTSRNAVAIVATHSPVVLQEVPRTCVWKLRRNRLESITERPEGETFAENVGVLTREIFGLEVVKSGFHDLLEESVASGKGYDEILIAYNNQLGFEGLALLSALIRRRDDQNGGTGENNT